MLLVGHDLLTNSKFVARKLLVERGVILDTTAC
jgi:hypothetical protein